MPSLMVQKPPNLIYGVEDRPAVGETFTLGFRHIFLRVSILILPVAIVQDMNGTPDQVERIIKMSMFAGGFATIAQALRQGPAGSGYLCPHLCGPSYLSASLLVVNPRDYRCSLA
jgi:xanthine permease XanP